MTNIFTCLTETILINMNWTIISGKICIDDIKRKFGEAANSRFPDGIRDDSIMCAVAPVYKELSVYCEVRIYLI